MTHRQTTEVSLPLPRETSTLRKLISDFAADKQLIPPLLQDSLLSLATDFTETYPEYVSYRKLIAVMLNNESWCPVVGAIPFDRRILLLPRCFRDNQFCPATTDELGILCERCGRCYIGEIFTKTESLGYHVVVSEGTTGAAMLLKSGQVECVIGVGCMDSLERTFPTIADDAIPAIAVPLRQGGCAGSEIDRRWLNAILLLRNDNQWYGGTSFASVRKTMDSWFDREKLVSLLGKGDPTTEIACEWLIAGGKRYRPLALATIYTAISGKAIDNDEIMRLVLAVECFHKASLVHDDIVDGDASRYGQETLPLKYGLPVALNVGDLLVGLGYQLISEASPKPEVVGKLLSVASAGHRRLCLGQGSELLWSRSGRKLSVEETIEIFRNKTSPAFEVALKMGAIAAEAPEELLQILEKYSDTLGIAYQIQDDIADRRNDTDLRKTPGQSPSILVALLNEAKEGSCTPPDNQQIIPTAEKLYESFRAQTFHSLTNLGQPAVKALLHRLANRLLKVSPSLTIP